MESSIHHGYLVLADISGYTSFIAETELDHGPNILRSLISLIVDELTPTLELAEVEGDAVFVYAPASSLTRGELLFELIEATYHAFRNRQRSMLHNATCPCKACRSIATLDLKFVTHYGPYILQEVAGHKKPVGSCVNLAHRLLKNNVSTATGWAAYALFSESSLVHLGIDPYDAHHAVETYEHLGEVPTASMNLDARYREMVETHRDVLTPEEADVAFHYDFQIPRPVVWDWLSDPHKRADWMTGTDWTAQKRPLGRTRPAAQNHCANSGVLEFVLDWRPFDYYTVQLRRGRMRIKITGQLDPLPEEGTHLRWTMKLDNDLPVWVRRPLSRMLASFLGMERNLLKLDGLLTEAYAKRPHGAANPVETEH